MQKSTKKQIIASLERKLQEALSGQVHNYHFASDGLKSATIDKMMASGVVITLHALGGREIIPPTLIRDGLSNELINALRADFLRSYELATMYKPKI